MYLFPKFSKNSPKETSTKLPLCWCGHRISIQQDRHLRMRSDPISSHQSLVEIIIGNHLKWKQKPVWPHVN